MKKSDPDVPFNELPLLPPGIDLEPYLNCNFSISFVTHFFTKNISVL
jgi:hypothetical protein